MKTRTKNTSIKMKLNSGFNIDITYPKGTDAKDIVMDLINWAADDKLEEFQAKINERIEVIKLNN